MSDLVFTTDELRRVAQQVRDLAHRIDGTIAGAYQTRMHDLARKLSMIADEYDDDSKMKRWWQKMRQHL